MENNVKINSRKRPPLSKEATTWPPLSLPALVLPSRDSDERDSDERGAGYWGKLVLLGQRAGYATAVGAVG